MPLRESSVRRLLVVWQIGLGKTVGMIRVVENFFDENRPKLILLSERIHVCARSPPNDELVTNFYTELCSHSQNRYLQH